MNKHRGSTADPLDEPEKNEEARLFAQMIHQAITDEWDYLIKNIKLSIKRRKLANDSEAIDQLAQDVLHDTFVKALEITANYTPEKSLKHWLWFIAFNNIRHLRRKRITERRHIMLASDAISELKNNSAGVPNTMSEEEMLDLLSNQHKQSVNSPTLDELLSLITGGDREILRLVYVDGLEGKDLAASLTISEGAARVRLFRAIARLREAYLGSELSREKE